MLISYTQIKPPNSPNANMNNEDPKTPTQQNNPQGGAQDAPGAPGRRSQVTNPSTIVNSNANEVEALNQQNQINPGVSVFEQPANQNHLNSVSRRLNFNFNNGV